MNKLLFALLLCNVFVFAETSLAADIKRRTAIVCVSQETEALTNFQGYEGDQKSEKAMSWFTQWFLSTENTSPSEVRFLWTPHSPTNPPSLKIASDDANHALIQLLSQTRHGLLVATSGSGYMTNIGWMFAINFKSEQVIATSVYSNFGGMRGQAINYSCSFNSQLS